MTAAETTLVSWNVNGLRAAAQKGFHGSVQAMNADIVAISDHCPVGLTLAS